MKLPPVVGHTDLLSELTKLIDDDRLPHALLFKGKNGHGPLPIALSLASYLLTPQHERDFAHASNSYIKAVSCLHPDLHFAFPAVKHPSKARKDTTAKDFIKEWREALHENPYLSISDWLISISTTNSPGDINVAECNQIINNLSLKPFESENKIQIIWMPEYLGTNGNKLLKLLEEPPDNSYIFLACESTEFVLSTITSRCQIINVSRIYDDEIEEQMVVQHKIPSDKAKQIALLADGDYAMAISVLSIDSDNSIELIMDWIKACQTGLASEVRNWIVQFTELGSEERKGSLQLCLKMLREIVNVKILGISRSKLPEQDYELIQKNVILSNLSIKSISDISNIVNNSIDSLQRNANPRILMFQSSLEIGQIIKRNTPE